MGLFGMSTFPRTTTLGELYLCQYVSVSIMVSIKSSNVVHATEAQLIRILYEIFVVSDSILPTLSEMASLVRIC